MEVIPTELLDVTVASWTVDDVVKWLKLQGFSDEICQMFKDQEVDGYTLLKCEESDFRLPPMSLKNLGVIKHLVGALTALKSTTIAKVELTPTPTEWILSNSKEQPSPGRHSTTEKRVRKNFKRLPSEDGDDSDSEDDSQSVPKPDSSRSFSSLPIRHRRLPLLKAEVSKAFVALGYFSLSVFITAFVMVVVHDRVPDMEKYPPLPDFVLDNVPYIPWAFELCEVAGFILSVAWFLVALFHKHRFILMRRFFGIMGSIFILRSICMLITSLSVPGRHLKCTGKVFGDTLAKLEQAWFIARGMGSAIRGVRTCGDYMFSGHTVVLTVLNHFVTEYTPKRFRLIHLSSWVLNMFGMFFILAAHEHYSIDVFVAFYISSRMFLSYHSMANSEYLHRHPNRAALYYPLFTFFECNVYRVVPNEYEWPFTKRFPFVKVSDTAMT